MSQGFADFQYSLQYDLKRYRGWIIAAAMLLVALWLGVQMFYKVDADSQGVVLRLGKHVATTAPGLHWKLPWPVDQVYVVPVEKVQATEFGYRTISPGEKTTYARPTEEMQSIARMLTGDLNLAHVEFVVQYQIRDPYKYLFRVGGEGYKPAHVNASELIGDVGESVMRHIVGDKSVDSVITTGREQIADQARDEMQKLLDEFDAGVRVVAVKLQSATPPDPVKDAFDAVNRAKQSKERMVNEAKGERNKLIPAARGKRDRQIAEAEGYAIRVQKEAEGQASAFVAQLKAYELAPQVTMTRLYLETMADVLGQVDDKVVIDRNVPGMLPLLNLDNGPGALPAGHQPRED